MLVAVTSLQCRHRGFIPHDMLSQALACSRCGSCARFERGEEISTQLDFERKPWPRVTLYERVQVPTGQLHEPWGEDG
jgi:hypothetical protein